MENIPGKNKRLGIHKYCLLMAYILGAVASVFAQADVTGVVRNAVLEGIQISSEATSTRGEKVVTCYFIFKDKPSSYFYEIKKKLKRMVFEFNDTEKGTSPIASINEPPLGGFVIEQKKIDVNKEVKGLNQEWHDLVAVTFDLAKIPRIDVKDEYNVISFSYRWTSDPSKEEDYEIGEDNRNKVVVLGTVGATGLIGGGILWYFLTHKGSSNEPEGPIPTNDLPIHNP